MGIKTTVTDGAGDGHEAAVVKLGDLPAGLVVYAADYTQVIGQTKPIVNPTYGADMNQNVAFGGTPVVVHDGTDSVAWTASALTGTWDFASTTQANSGTKSIDATATVDNDEAQLEGGASVTASSYAALSGFIYLTSWATSGTKEVRLRCRLAGTDLGVEIDLSSYIDISTLNAWQAFAIPVEAFGLGGLAVDQIIIKTVDVGGGAAPSYYLDDMQWEETGSAVFTVEPDIGSVYSVSQMQISIVDAYDSTLASSSHQKIPYNTLLGLAKLTNGINIKLTTTDVVRFNSNFKQHIDFMAFPGTETQSGGDGTNSWLTYTVPLDPPFVLDSRTGDKMEVTLSDDLSGLLHLRMLVRGGKTTT